jgi:hypothetical protein
MLGGMHALHALHSCYEEALWLCKLVCTVCACAQARMHVEDALQLVWVGACGSACTTVLPRHLAGRMHADHS